MFAIDCGIFRYVPQIASARFVDCNNKCYCHLFSTELFFGTVSTNTAEFASAVTENESVSRPAHSREFDR